MPSRRIIRILFYLIGAIYTIWSGYLVWDDHRRLHYHQLGLNIMMEATGFLLDQVIDHTEAKIHGTDREVDAYVKELHRLRMELERHLAEPESEPQSSALTL